VARDWAGHDVFYRNPYDLESNRQWVRQIIKNRQTVYLGSDINPDNVYDFGAGRQRPFGVEVEMRQDAGYTQRGHYLIPPPVTELRR
jgi:hypothetical protein